MKKSLIAAAVAGLFAAPAFAATSNVDVYGLINIAIEDTDASGKDLGVLDNTSRIGFKGSEDLGGGLKAIWQIESALGGNGGGAIGGSGTEGLGSRNTFVGLSGDFGTALMGRHDTPYKLSTGSIDQFSDTIGDYNLGRVDGAQLLDNTHDARSPQAVAYISPNFSGFSFAAAVVMGDAQDEGAALVGDSEELDAYSLSGTYANGPLMVTAAYQDAESAGSVAWKVGGSYAFGDLTVGAVYEDVENDAVTGHPVGANGERNSWLVSGKYAMGPIALKGQYGQAEVNSADQAMWAIGADYAMSKRTTAYVVYAAGDDDSTVTNGGDVGGWNIGVKHSF